MFEYNMCNCAYRTSLLTTHTKNLALDSSSFVENRVINRTKAWLGAQADSAPVFSKCGMGLSYFFTAQSEEDKQKGKV